MADRRRVLRRALIAVGVVVALAGAAVAAAGIYVRAAPRPPDTTEVKLLVGGGGDVDHCDLPVLDGSGPAADEIPVAYTPGCEGWTEWPLPVLAACTEPLTEGAPDLRGLWLDDDSGHLERVEQCGDRVVVTTVGLIHDMRADGTLRNGVNDVSPSCTRIRNRTRYRDGVLEMDGYGIPWIRVERWMEGEELRWTHPLAGSHRMKRICHVPPDRLTREPY
ncbi:MAG: hypothetical protein OXI49_00100 [Acidobacteriota bacterium]|nr:hypothetical protein [Acidobacteriota bacterium]